MARKKTEDREWDGERGDDGRDDAPTDVYAGRRSHVAKEARGEMTSDEKDKDRPGRKRGGKASRMDRFNESSAKRKDDREEADHEKRHDGRFERKRGGATEHEHHEEAEHEKRETDGRFERKAGGYAGKSTKMSGHAAKRRLDRPGRKRGGGIGSDVSPLSSAARVRDRRDGAGEEAVTGGA